MKNNDLLKEFQIQLNKLSADDAHFTVALSGGLDSVVLLHLFSRIKKSTVIAHHIHHGLSENADDWALFCQRFSAQLDIECHITKVILDNKNRTSLEAVAREKRYNALKEGFTDASYLVTAHHQDDQLETVLLALKRGAGLTGLQGIVANQSLSIGYLIRPLLSFSRQQLENYATEFELQWIEDESNDDQRFDRNFIRHTITPLLKERWPAITKTVARSASHCQNQQALINEITHSDFLDCLLNPQLLKIDTLKKLPEVRRKNVLRHWFKKAELNYPSSKQLIAIWENVVLAQEDAEPQLSLQGKHIRRYRGALYLTDNNLLATDDLCKVTWQGDELVNLCMGKIKLKIEKNSPEVLTLHSVEIYFRKDLPENIQCQPIGRDKRRSVKKLFSEYHVPPWLRDQVPFIFIDGELVEAVGIFKCKTAFSNLLNITII